jgi:hypothetical protein
MQTRPHFPSDFAEADITLCEAVGPYTMTGAERVYALANAVRHITGNRIPGDVVECGVWRGGSMMAVAMMLQALGETARNLYLFDTFEGMTPPTDADRDNNGEAAADILARTERRAEYTPAMPDPKRAPQWNMWCIADEADVRANMRRTGYPEDRVKLVRGDILETLPAQAPQQIALLRLDTDWYESTHHELIHLYPRLVPGGVLIVDDYGLWQGAHRAVDEYFATLQHSILLVRVDSAARVGVKIT